MKLKRIAIIILITLATVLIASTFNQVYAATGSMYLKITMLRRSGYGYKALEKNIWKIVETNSSGTTTDYSQTIYCLKGGPGFGSSNFGSGATTHREYTRYYDMKDPDSIPNTYASTLPSTTSRTYKSLLWLLENVYVAPKENASSTEKANAREFRELLLNKAGVNNGYLTDDDIDAVQQLAVWHFTNDDAYHIEDGGTFEFWINAIAGSDANYNPMSEDINENGWDRADDCQALYDYLVDTATQMGSSYVVETASQPYELIKQTKTIKTVGNNYVIGPYKIEKISNTTGSLEGTFKNGTTTINPTLQDVNGNVINSLEETIGKDFYISIPITTTIDNITFEINGSYFETTLTYWSVEGAPEEDQPVVVVERTKETYEDNDQFTPPDEKPFDLALRKFIVSINGVAPETSREPQISNETLANLANGTTTTAEKVHPKNALVVKTGDKVIYKIRVYNEGEIDAYAKQITDYLPDGLKFVENSTVNTSNGWTNPSGDGKTIVTDKLSGTLLKAFDGTNLQYLDVEIECEVTAKLQDTDTSLKNIAEITEQTDGEGNLVIDRDSTPNNVDKNNYGDKNQEDDDDFEKLVVIGKNFDLALRKFIISINGVAPETSREPQINSETLNDLKDGKVTTTNKVHPKNALVVKTGDKVIYKIRVYNEGDVDAYVKQITDYLPDGLKFVENSTVNTSNGWTNPSGDGKTIVTDKLSGTLLKAFDGTNLLYLDVEIECEVTATVKDKDTSLKNIAEITEHSDDTGDVTITDRDSTPNNVNKDSYGTTNQEDDDDFEQLVILGQYFDLSLRKFITAVNESQLVDENGKYLREPVVDTSTLLNGGTTATYNHPKTPLGVAIGDEVIYTLRVYNEGQLDGYVNEITDYLPNYLEFVNDEFNASYGWEVSADGRIVKTTITSPDTEFSASRDTIYANRTEATDKVLLKAFDGKTLDYIDVKIKCKVKDTGLAQKLTNIAEITKFVDSNKNTVTDRDSVADNITLPADNVLPNYKDTEINRGDQYIPGQQDDDDFEKIIVQKFDLALRKFITGVNDTAITNRVPVFSMDDNKNFTYTHPKTPVEVANGDIIIYTLRVYNEGNQAGYAEEIKDNLPEGLEYLPDNAINKEYRWKMYKEDGTETENASEAKTIKTDYLSKAQETETGRDNLLDAFDMKNMTMPDFKDIKIAFKVIEPNTSDRVLINIAEITEDKDENGNPVEDVDSTPNNDKDGEDDMDEEQVKVKYFDLSLKKIITKVTMTLDGKTTVTQTGHKFDQEPEPVVKIELGNHKIKTAVIKFTYQIRVMNEGEIEGYVKEIKDYIPEGLKFVAEDNKNWTLSEDGKTVTTDQLKDTLLQPGESAVVEITLRWINGQNNLGLKKNIAEISEDYNDHDDTNDIDSTPDNKKEGEDDINDASVVLTIVTGIGENYIIITTGVLAMLAAGVVLIKKFVI